jgi:hypothetical protein
VPNAHFCAVARVCAPLACLMLEDGQASVPGPYETTPLAASRVRFGSSSIIKSERLQ